MKLLEIYNSILLYSGLEADSQGYVSTVMDDKREPTFINGVRLVLPTQVQLKQYQPGEKVYFHPLTENILRGESDIIQKLKHNINIKLNFTIGIIAQSLLNLVASPELHGQLTPEQSEVLLGIKDCDEKSVVNFISIMVNGIKARPDRIFSNIYLKRGGLFNGEKHSRVGVVSFPFYQELLDDKVDKIRVKDKETYKQLFEFMLPELNHPENYNYGSNSQVAPYLDTLMHTSANIASRLNDLLIVFNDHIDEAEKLSFDADWLEYFSDLDALIPEIRKIPVQLGNDGGVDTNDVVPQVQQQSAPVQQQQPVMYPNQQNMQTMTMQEPPKPKVTPRGLDFKSMVQANPNIAASGNPLASRMMMPMGQPMPQAPMWAQPPQQMMPMGQMQQPMMPMGQMQQPMQYPIINTPYGPMMQTPNGLMPVQQQGVNLNQPAMWPGNR